MINPSIGCASLHVNCVSLLITSEIWCWIYLRLC